MSASASHKGAPYATPFTNDVEPEVLHNGLPLRRDWFCQNCNHFRGVGRIAQRCRHRTAGRDDQKRGVKIMQLPYQRVRVAR